MLSRFSHVQIFVTLGTIVCQAPLSMGFSRQNTGVGCHAFFQGIFPTQGSKLRCLCLLHSRWILYLLSHLGSQINQIYSSKVNMSYTKYFFYRH